METAHALAALEHIGSIDLDEPSIEPRKFEVSIDCETCHRRVVFTGLSAAIDTGWTLHPDGWRCPAHIRLAPQRLVITDSIDMACEFLGSVSFAEAQSLNVPAPVRGAIQQLLEWNRQRKTA